MLQHRHLRQRPQLRLAAYRRYRHQPVLLLLLQRDQLEQQLEQQLHKLTTPACGYAQQRMSKPSLASHRRRGTCLMAVGAFKASNSTSSNSINNHSNSDSAPAASSTTSTTSISIITGGAKHAKAPCQCMSSAFAAQGGQHNALSGSCAGHVNPVHPVPPGPGLP